MTDAPARPDPDALLAQVTADEAAAVLTILDRAARRAGPGVFEVDFNVTVNLKSRSITASGVTAVVRHRGGDRSDDHFYQLDDSQAEATAETYYDFGPDQPPTHEFVFPLPAGE